MGKKINALIIDDSAHNSAIYIKTLQKSGYNVSAKQINTQRKFKQALLESSWDIILYRYKIPKFNVASAIQILKDTGLNIPFIVVALKRDPDIVVRLIKKGASNFILKKNINTLPKVIKSEIAELKLKTKEVFDKEYIPHSNQVHFRTLFENSPTPLWEEEFSELDKYLKKLKEKGVKDFRKYFDNKPAELIKCLSKINIIDVNKAALKLYRAKTKDDLIKNLDKIFTGNSYNFFKEELIAISKGKREFEGEVEIKTLTGEIVFVIIKLKIDKYEKGLKHALISTVDITSRKKTEKERQSNLKFFEALEVVNKSIQGTHNLEQMMKDVLDKVLTIFECDRSFLLYPCDTASDYWEVPIERNNPEYPGVHELGIKIPMDKDERKTLRILLDTKGPVKFGPNSNYKLPKNNSERFSFKSLMSMALYPKIGKPWEFGIHQCSHERIWSEDEEKLLNEIGRRLEDGLTSLLILNNLKESESRYREIFENTSNIIVTSEVVGKRHFKIIDINPACEKFFSLKHKDLVGKLIHNLNDDEITKRDLERYHFVLENKSSVDFIDTFQTFTGNQIVHTTLIPIFDSIGNVYRILSVGHNITEQNKAEESLKLYTSRLEKAEKDAKLGSWEFNVINQKGWWSNQMYKMLGFGEYNDVPSFDIYLEHIHEEDREYINKVLQNMASGIESEIKILRTNPDLGPVRYFQPTYQVLRDNTGAIIKFTGTLYDISDRKLSEDALEKLNRELRAISNCNQILLRVDDEQTLLNEICNIICKEADYKFAWVGYAENDENKTIRPVAWSGFEDGYIEKAKLSWSEDTERGKGPAGIAVRTGELVYSQDFTKDKKMKPWVEGALKRGFRSGIALPLKDENKKSFGVLLIYSSETNNISQDEVRLMVELADDLAFGIINLRSRIERRKAEDALRESEERYRIITENTVDTIAVFDLNLKPIYMSPSVFKLRGYTAEEAMQQSLDQILTPNSLEVVHEVLNRQTALETSGNADLNRIEMLELEEYRKDGSVIMIELSASFLRDKNFKPTSILTVTRDITERKRAENTISESEKRFKELANLLPQTVFEADINGKITFANETALATFGYSNEDIENGIQLINIISKKDKKEAIENLQRILKGLPSLRNEYEMVRKNGITFPAITFISPIIRDKETIGMRGTIVDITNRKETEDELRKLSEAVAQSPASIIITDLNGNINYVNKTFEEISGYSFKEVINKNTRVLKSGRVPREKYQDLWKTITLGKTWRGELLNKKKSGELYWEDVLISPLINKDGKIINYLSVQQDITEKKKILQELIEAKEEAEEMNRVKTIFFANMSHELRTPFVGIMGFAELLTETLTDPEAKEMADGILRTSIRMKDTLTKILNLSKLEVNEIQTFPRKVDIRLLINNIYKQYSIAASKKNLSFSIHVNVDKPLIFTDEVLLTEILNNLISNAIIYTLKGSIDLFVENQTKEGKQVLIVKVVDTGIGIPTDKQDLVWKEFRQASEGTTRSYQGTGLGLSISKKYTELLGGKIYLESKEGSGSTFTLELPYIDIDYYEKVPKNISASNSDIIPEEEFQKKIILYVEDDDTSIEVIKISLSKQYRIEIAKDAEIALSKVKEQIFDAILMDINLGPGMNGIELTQLIRKLPNYETIPIIAVTAYANEEDKKEFLSKGMNHYLAKPFLIQDLVMLVKDVLYTE